MLRNVSISVERGSRVLLVGANGAGKSTLLRIFAGKHIVPRGSVSVRLVLFYVSPALVLLLLAAIVFFGDAVLLTLQLR